MRSDTPLGGGRLSAGDVGRWLDSYWFRAEAALRAGGDLATTVGNFMLRRLLRCGGARIHVSGMSDSWVRLHETEYGKHRPEL